MSPLLPRQPSLITRARQVLAWTLGGGCVLAVLVATGDHIAHGETFQVQEVSFVGNSMANATQLRHLADVRRGTHLFGANLDRAVQGVEQHPWVNKASARRRFPGSVEIHVREYTPRLLLAIDDLWLVDENGTIFTRADSDSMDFPILTGIEPTLLTEHPNIARAIIDDATRLHEAVDADEQLADSDLSEIHFNAQVGFSLILRSGTQVILGFADAAPALDRLSRMRERGLNIDTPQRIDLDVGSVAIATPL